MVFNAMFPGRKAVYKGEKDKRGRPHGRGRLQNINGDFYEGEFSEGKPHGLGLYTFRKNNCTYQGAFRAGLYHGQGVETYENGSKYEGEFEAGIRHGAQANARHTRRI